MNSIQETSTAATTRETTTIEGTTNDVTTTVESTTNDCTTMAPYCDADTCQNLAMMILDLEKKVNNFTYGFASLQNQNEELKIENQEIKAENKALREDVSELQGMIKS